MLALPQQLEPALYNAVAALVLIRRLVIPALAPQCTQNPREVAKFYKKPALSAARIIVLNAKFHLRLNTITG